MAIDHPESSRAPAHMCRQGKTAVSRGSLRQITQSSVGHQGPQTNWAVKWGLSLTSIDHQEDQPFTIRQMCRHSLQTTKPWKQTISPVGLPNTPVLALDIPNVFEFST